MLVTGSRKCLFFRLHRVLVHAGITNFCSTSALTLILSDRFRRSLGSSAYSILLVTKHSLVRAIVCNFARTAVKISRVRTSLIT